METLLTGLLLKPKGKTICWKERDGTISGDLPVRTNDVLLLCSDETSEVIPGLYTVRVLHPKYGQVTCILDELIPVNCYDSN